MRMGLTNDWPACRGELVASLQVIVPDQVGRTGSSEHAVRGTCHIVMTTLTRLVITRRLGTTVSTPTNTTHCHMKLRETM